VKRPSHNLRARSGFNPILWLCFAALLAALAAPLRSEVAKEYELKAAFVFNFTKFVEWPVDRFEDEDSPIVIAVIGSNPLADQLEVVVAGRSVNGRAIIVRKSSKPEDARGAHVVFVGTDVEPRGIDLVSAFDSAGVLTVGETREFSARGGIIVFNTDSGRVRFEINQASGERARLKISAQLLKLASQVRRSN
jgi:hypothetical protein